MNEYKALLDEGVVIFRFFDEYAAAVHEVVDD